MGPARRCGPPSCFSPGRIGAAPPRTPSRRQWQPRRLAQLRPRVSVRPIRGDCSSCERGSLLAALATPCIYGFPDKCPGGGGNREKRRDDAEVEQHEAALILSTGRRNRVNDKQCNPVRRDANIHRHETAPSEDRTARERGNSEDYTETRRQRAAVECKDQRHANTRGEPRSPASPTPLGLGRVNHRVKFIGVSVRTIELTRTPSCCLGLIPTVIAAPHPPAGQTAACVPLGKRSTALLRLLQRAGEQASAALRGPGLADPP